MVIFWWLSITPDAVQRNVMHLDGKIMVVTGESTKIYPSKSLCYMVVAVGYIAAKVCIKLIYNYICIT